MVGGMCQNNISHTFGRLKTVPNSRGYRTIVVKVGLQTPCNDDFCVRCGLLRKDINKYKKKKKKSDYNS
jgi:hypothetical protein